MVGASGFPSYSHVRLLNDRKSRNAWASSRLKKCAYVTVDPPPVDAKPVWGRVHLLTVLVQRNEAGSYR